MCGGARPVMSVGVQLVLSVLASSRVCRGPLVRDGLQNNLVFGGKVLVHPNALLFHIGGVSDWSDLM